MKIFENQKIYFKSEKISSKKSKKIKLKVKFFENQKFHFKSVKIELQGKLMNIANSPPQAKFFAITHFNTHKNSVLESLPPPKSCHFPGEISS